jgi:hypothetical protein
MKLKIPPIIITYLNKLKPLARHHYFIITVILLSAVAGAIYAVNTTLNDAGDDNYHAKQLQATIGSKFNKSTNDTIDKIKSLQKSTDGTSQTKPLPSGRINPFAE